MDPKFISMGALFYSMLTTHFRLSIAVNKSEIHCFNMCCNCTEVNHLVFSKHCSKKIFMNKSMKFKNLNPKIILAPHIGTDIGSEKAENMYYNGYKLQTYSALCMRMDHVDTYQRKEYRKCLDFCY